MPDSRAQRHTTGRKNGLRHGARADEVVNNRAPRPSSEKPVGNNRCSCRTRERRSLLIDEERSICIPIECDPEIRSSLTNESHEINEVLRSQRISGMVRERAVRLQVQADKFRIDAIEDLREHSTGHAVPSIGCYGHVGNSVCPSDLDDVLDIPSGHALFSHLTTNLESLNSLLSHAPNILKACLGTDRGSLGLTELQPVVLRWVVRCRDHNTRERQDPRSKVQHVSWYLPKKTHADTLAGHSTDQRVSNSRRRGPAVVAHEHFVRINKSTKGCSDSFSSLLIEFVREDAAYVVGLHDVGEIHCYQFYDRWQPDPTSNTFLHFLVMENPTRPTVTVVIPVHNEAEFLPTVLEQLFDEMNEVNADVEVLIVENGSTDETADFVRDAMSKYQNLQLLQLPTPDYGAAMRDGFLSATSEWVVNFDIDYFSGDFLAKALVLAESCDVVLASKRTEGADDQRSATRRLATWAFNQILRSVLSSGVTDTHGMKFLRKTLIDDIVPHVISTTDLFDTELIVRAERAGYRIIEIPVRVEEVRESKSNLLKRVPRTLQGIWRIRKAL